MLSSRTYELVASIPWCETQWSAQDMILTTKLELECIIFSHHFVLLHICSPGTL